ncbi:unnamed protein product [Wuchereria bancrofti]|uniref:Uncharacterized protein n=1 Tax=Wuchereria bancrofti TaxID=6293 RepID=A0A3P7GK21_WUCBA|nr:unnamed protein product [Wuchereria bancrofti]
MEKATVKTSSGKLLNRPINLFYLMEMNEEDSDEVRIIKPNNETDDRPIASRTRGAERKQKLLQTNTKGTCCTHKNSCKNRSSTRTVCTNASKFTQEELNQLTANRKLVSLCICIFIVISVTVHLKLKLICIVFKCFKRSQQKTNPTEIELVLSLKDKQNQNLSLQPNSSQIDIFKYIPKIFFFPSVGNVEKPKKYLLHTKCFE